MRCVCTNTFFLNKAKKRSEGRRVERKEMMIQSGGAPAGSVTLAEEEKPGIFCWLESTCAYAADCGQYVCVYLDAWGRKGEACEGS